LADQVVDELIHLPRTIGRILRQPITRAAYHKSGRPRGWLRFTLGGHSKPQNNVGLITAIHSTGLFDEKYYRANNPDVVEAGLDPALHFAVHGWKEGRKPSPDFDPAYYLSQNIDVVRSGLNPLLHYAAHGRSEGRQAIHAAADPDIRSEADPYTRWIEENETLDESDRLAIRAHIAALARRPLISIVVPVYNTDVRHLRAMIGSVLQQIYPYWELCLADDASTKSDVKEILSEFAQLDSRIKVVIREINGNISLATNSALDVATGEFIALLDHDDLLAETALYEVAVEVDAHADADVVYSDSDSIDDSGRRFGPYFKTDWNPDLALGHNMVSHLGVYRRSLVEKIGRLRAGFEGSQDYDLMLRAADASTPRCIRHIPAVLYHWRRNATSPSFSDASSERCVVAARRAVREHLARNGAHARIDVPPRTPFWLRVVYALPPERPLVSIIVPTQDRADLLARCVDGVLTRTDYEPLELLIVDNDSKESETALLFARLAEDPRVRIIQYPGNFNYSAMNNRAVQEARGEVIVLMNNDVDVISSLWLEEMVSHALRPEIGAVGAKLLLPDGRVQHAGVVLGVGHGAGHFFHLASREEVGPLGLLVLTRRVSAVTGACMAIRRSVYVETGGLDENFPVAFNDVDFCLRLGERGYAVVWTPFAELYHLESATRGKDHEDAKRLERLERDAKLLQQRWAEALDSDPFYNANCSLAADFAPGFPSRRRQPWLKFKEQHPPSATLSRAEALLAPLDRSASIFEVGPSYNPIAPKADGWKTSVLASVGDPPALPGWQ
jgi:glycosyltransferase involved in cell wall biosynthesis